jgi:hypothetical protein
MSSGGSSSGKGFSIGTRKGGRKGPLIVWEGSVGSDSFFEVVYEFSVESKSDFSNEAPLRVYDNRKEDWPKCIYGEDCLVQMCADGTDGGRHFFKCPRAWVILRTICLLNMVVLFCTTNTTFLLQSSDTPENCGFVMWVDPSPIHPH